MPTVLVVENDVPAMRLMAWGLMEEGFEVAVAHIPDALDYLSARRPEFIVFNTLKRTDEKAALVAEFRVRAPYAKIIDVAEEAESVREEVGADAHLASPLEIRTLVKTMNQMSQ